MTNEELEKELAEAQQVIGELVEHCQNLAEKLRETTYALLPTIRELNDAYKQHADFMTKVEEGMRAYVERKTKEAT